ncbi:hypothetical protein [Ferrimicrobium acidiphilum]|uniref:hypothetical protein n=1 Tax=Ferrimicrobium acidiphilum TaxID=121039 RepID=UPI0023F30199|nr:hypothetical protein [Ferrimicrobium acidiphilum]
MQARRARVARQRAKPDAAAFAVSRRTFLGAVADQDSDQRSVSGASGDRLEEILVAVPTSHQVHQDRHAGQVPPRHGLGNVAE